MAKRTRSVESVTQMESWEKEDYPGCTHVLTTFGCSCCSTTHEVGPEEARAALLEVKARLEKNLADVNKQLSDLGG